MGKKDAARVVIFLRVEPDLKLALEAVAARNGRTLNAEVAYRLQRSMEGWKQ